MTGIETSFFLIFTGAAVLATLALQLRQPILVAYIALGALIGPYGTGAIDDTTLLASVSNVGIVFLLFLLGLDLQPQSLMRLFGRMSLVAFGSSALFALVGGIVALAFGFSRIEAAVIGMAMAFSSTIIALKLLPTTALHHKHTGELVIGLTLLQDVIAILALVLVTGDPEKHGVGDLLRLLATLPALAAAAGVAVRFVLVPLLIRFDRFKEYVFLLAVGWCLGIAELAHLAGLSREIGAFIAGVALASSPIAYYIAEQLKPLRDFFLVLFFFSVGAGFNHGLLGTVWVPALLLTVLVLVLKPVVFAGLLRMTKEPWPIGWEIGFRLGHCSEFSLLLAYLAATAGLLGDRASILVQATTLATMLIASYVVVLTYPSPIAVSDRLRKD